MGRQIDGRTSITFELDNDVAAEVQAFQKETRLPSRSAALVRLLIRGLAGEKSDRAVLQDERVAA